MNPYALSNAEALKRAFFKETINHEWSFHERSKVFKQCHSKSSDFAELLSVLRQFIEYIDGEYFEPHPIESSVWQNDMHLMSDDAEFFLYQYSLTEEFTEASKLITDGEYFDNRL